MDDRTIIDDDSQRITNVMEANPGDLLVLGRMVDGDFKQKAWLVVSAVDPHFNKGFKDGVCIDVNKLELFVSCEASRDVDNVLLVTDDSLEDTGLHFDCLIRPRVYHKRGIYKDQFGWFVYFDGDKSFVYLMEIDECTFSIPVEKSEIKWSGMTLLYSFDEDDDNGKKNI